MSHLKTGGTYSEITGVSVKEAGAYVSGTAAFKKEGGTYVQFFGQPSQNTDDPLFVIMGASIMSQAFNQVVQVQDDINLALGSDIRVQNIAIGGGRLSTLSQNIASTLDNINVLPNRDIYCVLHIGGNDMNTIRPISDDLFESSEPFAGYWDIVIAEIESRGYIPVIGSLTYRTYNGSASPDVTTEDTGSAPYNAKFWIPDANRLTPNFVFPSGIPFFQLYEELFEGGDSYMSDGVHPNTLGVQNIRELFQNNVVAPIVTSAQPAQIFLTNGRPNEAVLSLDSNTDTSAVLSWKPVAHPLGILQYDVYLDGVFNQTVAGNVTTATITGLSPQSKYRVHVITEANNNEVSYESNDIYVLTDAVNGAKLLSYLNLNKRVLPISADRLSPWDNTGRRNFMSRRNTSTTTPNTGPVSGPDENGVQQTGLYYLYVETSGGAGNGGPAFIEGDPGDAGNNATVESDAIDANGKNLFLKMFYHMHFNNGPSTQLSYMVWECFDGTNWVEEFRATGQQQAVSGDDFLTAKIDASAYTNADFKFRFRMIFIGTNASAWRDASWAQPKIFDGDPD